MKYLITLRVESRGRELWGHSIVDDPIESLARLTEKFPEETYYLVNQCPITDEQAERYDGALGGM